jgi:hypothetical protein
MTDNTCNGWRNAATWTVNLWFGDTWADMSHEGDIITAEFCRETVEEIVEFMIRDASNSQNGFIWDMLDLNSVDWDALAEHHADMMDEPA